LYHFREQINIKDGGFMNRLDKSVESLVESYKEYGVVNHSGAVNLPSRESVIDILADLD
jgi:hypothetical protein